MHLCPIIFFPFKFFFVNEILLRLLEKTKQLYVLLVLVECHSTTASFDLWMSKVKHDILHW